MTENKELFGQIKDLEFEANKKGGWIAFGPNNFNCTVFEAKVTDPAGKWVLAYKCMTFTFDTPEEAKAAANAHHKAEMSKYLEPVNPVLSEVSDLINAVEALPVEEWVQQDANGDPELLGYVMQAQGEWDDVVKALALLQPNKDD